MLLTAVMKRHELEYERGIASIGSFLDQGNTQRTGDGGSGYTRERCRLTSLKSSVSVIKVEDAC